MPDYMNVKESWEMHDTLCVCNNLFGSEANAGYFASFQAFGQRLEHLFFKGRNEGNVHRAYCNQQSEDRADFVFHAFTVGLLFIGPPTTQDIDQSIPANPQEYMTQFWTQDLPRHCSASLKIGQDTNLTLNGMMMSPGYGPMTSGAAMGIDDIDTPGTYWPESIFTAVQGVPVPQSRYWIAGDPRNPEPIGIPKGELVEIKLKVSEHARDILTTAGGPGYVRFGQTGEGPGGSGVYKATRYSIQASIWGYREVQQRGQLRAPQAG